MIEIGAPVESLKEKTRMAYEVSNHENAAKAKLAEAQKLLAEAFGLLSADWTPSGAYNPYSSQGYQVKNLAESIASLLRSFPPHNRL